MKKKSPGKNGITKKARLLATASEVFAKKGYRETTVAEICEKADCNVAAVNYYYGSKEALYGQVWRTAFERGMEVYPPDGGLRAEAGPEERLAVHIRSLLFRLLDDRLGYAGQILVQELLNPSGVIEQVRQDAIQPLRNRTRRIIRELLGEDATERETAFCEMSVMHQCIAIGMRKWKLSLFSDEDNISPGQIEELAGHITTFSLAGIRSKKGHLLK